ncbi:ABC transporter substrate-binding protein [Marinobacterium iners]|uniref:TRAP transporter substrate-binding protein n=1 Tax=Marinobacterium iners TaxID=48076 RepID=UPI001A8E7A30|nr:TRAP transporter substrate-binding protein [Marinobacterium iners]QSR34601.1 ABC transporter substrate-binding protein [Marinobacterium iners]
MNAKTTIKTIMQGVGAATVLSISSFSVQATTLTLSNWVPPTHFVTTDILQVWADKVETATDGRVKVRMLPKPVGSPAQHWELARKGVADITWGNFTYEPERFKSLWFAELPFSGEKTEATSVALWDTYEKYLSDNAAFSGVKMLGVGTLGPGVINHSSKAIVTPEDLANQKVRMGGPIQKRLLEGLGAVPIAAPGTKAYELLEGGVLDASLHTLESVINFRLTELLPHHTEIQDGFYDATFFLVLNERKWKTISAEDQQAIMAVSGEAFARLWGSEFQKQLDQAKGVLLKEGHSFSTPSAELLDRIRTIRNAMLEEWAAEGPSFGVDNALDMARFYQQRYQVLVGQ